eukprot:62031-Rhodomonas_salina.1
MRWPVLTWGMGMQDGVPQEQLRGVGRRCPRLSRQGVRRSERVQELVFVGESVQRGEGGAERVCTGESVRWNEAGRQGSMEESACRGQDCCAGVDRLFYALPIGRWHQLLLFVA